jgi:hypothetical protein
VTRQWVLHAHELDDGRLVLGIEQPGGTTYADWLDRLAAAVERELAGELLGAPVLCPAALDADGTEVARRQ